MRAALLTQHCEDIASGDVPDPTVTSPDDVVVRVGAAGSCGRCSPRRASSAASAAPTTSWSSGGALAARGAVRLTTTTSPLDGIDEALHALDEGRMSGRGVLVPHES